MAHEIRTGLLGAGYISSWHADALRRVPNVRLTAVCDTNRKQAADLANAYDIPHIYDSLADMLAAGVCDVVHVLTPPSAHFDNTREILESGRHAFVEKPFTLSGADAETLVDLARSKELRLAVNHNFLALPSYERLKRDIADGVIGPIDTLSVSWQFPLPPLRCGPYGIWMLRRPENLLYELGPHLFAFVWDLVGALDNIDVRLKAPIAIPGDILHYQGWQVIGQAGNASVVINISMTEGHDNRSLEVRGAGALARVDFAQDAYTIERANSHDIVIGPLVSRLCLARQNLSNGIANAGRQLTSLNALAPYGLSIVRTTQAFYASLGGEADPRFTGDSGRAIIGMIDEAIAIALPKMAKVQPVVEPEAKPQPSVLVIGGTGFIGRYLVHALANAGFAVRVFSRSRVTGFERADGRVSGYSGSLKSRENLLGAMAGIDTVFDLARADEKTWDGYLANDVDVTRLIGECCLEAGVRRLVYTGTIDSYDASKPDRPITEETGFDHDLARRNLYARSKGACEDVLTEMSRTQGLSLVIARPGIVIGRGGPLQHWGIAKWFGVSSCKLWGDGRNTMPFVLVDDVADGLVKTMTVEGIEGQSFNLVGDPVLSARDYFAEIHRVTGLRIDARPTLILSYYLADVAKYFAKKYLARKKYLRFPSLRDWKSRSQMSLFVNVKAKTVLGWSPVADRQEFVERAITQANLIGLNPID